MDEKQSEKRASRKEILPVFIGTLVGATALFFAMFYGQPFLMGNNYIHDFVTMLLGAIEGSLYYKVLWFFADFTEATFIASVPASIFMIIAGFIVAYLERRGKRVGTGVEGHGKYFGRMFLVTAISIVLGMLIFGEIYPGWTGWIPTFAVVLTSQVFVIYYGYTPAKLITSTIVGTLVTFPICYLLMTFVVAPLSLPLFISVSVGVAIVVPLCTLLFKVMPWMKPEEKEKAPEGPPPEPSSPTSFFIHRIFGDVGNLVIWGSSVATIAMYIGAIIAWFLNPLEPGYAVGNFPLVIFSQVTVAALAIFIYYPKWKKEGWAFTFPGIVLVSAVVGRYAVTGTYADFIIAGLTIILGALVFAPLVEFVLKLFRYKGKYHIIPLIQVAIFIVCIPWSFIVLYGIMPLLV